MSIRPMSHSLTLVPLLLLYILGAACSDKTEQERVVIQEAPEIIYGEEPSSYAVKDCAPQQGGCQSVLDCSARGQNCLSRTVFFDLGECAKTEKRDVCLNFEKRFPSVRMISDSYNYISSPIIESQLSVELISDDLKRPWDIEVLPDGSLLATEKGGKIKHIGADGETTEVLSIDVIDTHEAGLMGLAIDPDFTENRYVYAVYTYKLDDTDPAFAQPKMWTHQRVLNKISRWTFNDGQLVDETVVLDGLPGSVEHCGLRLEFGPDGKLYASTGDATRSRQSQDLDFLGGKILRLNLDGSIPGDNPDPTSYVYSRGHRNPQGMAWHPQTGDMYASEHGPQRYDELNRIQPGRNYGWGSYKCDTRMARNARPHDVEFPVICYRYWNISPSGMTFVSDPQSPWHGSLFVTGLRGKHLARYNLEGDSVESGEIFYVSDGWNYEKIGAKGALSHRLRDVEYYEGALYVAGDVYGLVRLTPIAE